MWSGRLPTERMPWKRRPDSAPGRTPGYPAARVGRLESGRHHRRGAGSTRGRARLQSRPQPMDHVFSRRARGASYRRASSPVRLSRPWYLRQRCGASASCHRRRVRLGRHERGLGPAPTDDVGVTPGVILSRADSEHRPPLFGVRGRLEFHTASASGS